ncbi:hypothetical protein ACFU6R_26995 [Streptomyces sp. NPDC057499]|uniref:hypothetical protein n=1 Tax=Streptomyces sp. NPDC057499 TaxID=3346150 RepID=UPI0036BE70E2
MQRTGRTTGDAAPSPVSRRATPVKHLARLFAVLAVALATAVGVTSPASAESRVITGAYGYFDPGKVMFGLGDTEPDGHTVFISWHVDTYWGEFENDKGNGTWKDVYLPYDWPGALLEWKVCVTRVRCSSWVQERL